MEILQNSNLEISPKTHIKSSIDKDRSSIHRDLGLLATTAVG
jgi:hypothetical protein